MFERAWRSNSCSTRSSSGETRSKMRLAESRTSSRTALCSAACIVFRPAGLSAYMPAPGLVAPVIRELHVNAKVLRLQRSDHLLQSVAVFPRNSHHVALNRRLDFHLRVLDEPHDFLRLLLRDALLNLRSLLHGAPGGGFRIPVRQGLQRHSATHQFLLQNVIHVSQFGFVFGGKSEVLFFQRHCSLAVLEVKPLSNFFHGLVDRVHYLSAIDFRNDVK